MQTTASRKSGAAATAVEVLDDEQVRRRRADVERMRRWQLERLQINLRPEVVDLVVRDALDAAWPALRAIWAWEKKLRTGGRRALVLTGPCRTGKTTAAAWLAARARSSCEWVPAVDLAGRVEPWREDLARGVPPLDLGTEREPVYRDQTGAAVSPYAAGAVHRSGDHAVVPCTPLIIVDDLGTESNDARFARALYRLLEDRMRHGLLVITGNGLDELEERYGDRIAGRLEEIADLATVPARASRRA